jgi:hypothetical protein
MNEKVYEIVYIDDSTGEQVSRIDFDYSLDKMKEYCLNEGMEVVKVRELKIAYNNLAV